MSERILIMEVPPGCSWYLDRHVTETGRLSYEYLDADQITRVYWTPKDPVTTVSAG